MYLLKWQEIANCVCNVSGFVSLTNVQYLSPDQLGKYVNKPQ